MSKPAAFRNVYGADPVNGRVLREGKFRRSRRRVTGRIITGYIAILLGSNAYPISDQQHIYLERTDGVESSHTLSIRHSGNDIEMRWIAPDGSHFNRCDESGDTREWRFRDSSTDITAKRAGNLISLEGTRNGVTIQENREIDGSPWFQSLSYALGRFSQSQHDSVVFWSIRPDNLEVVKLRATRLGREEVMTGAGLFLARKISISANGLLSHFWKAHYWFRQEDGLFVRYQGANGLPGTPLTTIQLES